MFKSLPNLQCHLSFRIMKMLARGRWSPDDSDNCADIFFNRGMRFNIQKYDTQRLIGRGAFGSVYEYMSDDLKVAIKALNNIRDFKLFKHEIKILLHLQGLPNIIRCFGVLHKTDVSFNSEFTLSPVFVIP